MSSELYEQIVAQKGSFEQMVANLPGFKGYHEKNDRRTADRLLRDHLTNELDRHIKTYERLQKKLLDGGAGLKYMGRAREVKSAMQAYRDRVATAAPKYSGVFAQVKITNEILDRIYAFDEAQFRFLLQFDTVLDDLSNALDQDEGIDAALDALESTASDASTAFDMRDDEILNLANPG